MTEELVRFETNGGNQNEARTESLRESTGAQTDSEPGAIGQSNEGLSGEIHAANGASAAGDGEQPAQADDAQEKIKRLEDDFQKKFQALSRREREIYKTNKEVRDLRRELERLQNLENSLRENPYKLMEQYGGSLEGYTNLILNDGQPQEEDKIKSLESKIDKIYKEKEESQKKEVQSKRYNTYINEIQNIEKTYKEQQDKYPLVNLYQDAQLAFDIRAEKFRQDQEEFGYDYAKQNVMTVDEALQIAEDHRAESIRSQDKEALKLVKAKLDSLLGATEGSDKLKAVQESLNNAANPRQSRQGVRTLTNNQPVPAKEKRQFQTDRERLDYVSSLLKFNDETHA